MARINDLSDFINETFGIIRSKGDAEIVFDVVNGEPVKLKGFAVDPYLCDFEVYEKGFKHYKNLLKEVLKTNGKQG